MKRFLTFVLVAPCIAAIVTTLMLPAAIWHAGHPFHIDALTLWMGLALLVPYAMIGLVPAGLLSLFDGLLAKKSIWPRPLITAIAAFVVMTPFLHDAFGTAFPGNWRFSTRWFRRFVVPCWCVTHGGDRLQSAHPFPTLQTDD
jgi:hypothetical protein